MAVVSWVAYAVLAPAIASADPAAVQPGAPAPAAAPAAVAAAPSASGDKVVYESAFFAAFAPQTAYDMILRLPGFSLEETGDRRGFAGTAGNVLIDGARPSVKSQSLSDALGQIPAGQVARIEVLRNAGGDAQGQALVANVVRRSTSGAGVWNLEAVRSADDRISPTGDGSYSAKVGGVDLKFGASRYIERTPLAGWRAFTDPSGALISRRWDESPRTYREARANLEAATRLFGGDLKLNASAGRWAFRPVVDSQGYDPAGARTDFFTLRIHERQRSREIGGDWTRKFGPTTLKLVGLDTLKWHDEDDVTRTFDSSGSGLTTQAQRGRSRETILRGTATRTFGAHAIEIAVESARNSLRADLDLRVNGTPVPLPASDVLVEEDRIEASFADVWTLSPKWTIEARVAGESSDLTQTGDSRAKASFSFVKPSLQIARSYGARNQARLRFYRDVGQLNFNDFASKATLADDRVAAGNPGLRPDSRWRLEGGVDQRFGQKGAVSIGVYYDWIRDAQDLVPVDGFDAPGNLRGGRTLGVPVKITLPLDGVRKGLTATLDGEWRRGDVIDPTTGRRREITTLPGYQYRAELRRDDEARKLAYGLRYRKQAEFQFYRVGEIETYEEQGKLRAYVETTRVKGLKITLVGENLTNPRYHRERRFFAPTRRGSFAQMETRDRQAGTLVSLGVSGTF